MISINKLFEELSSFITNQRPKARDIRMPYCSLYEDPVTRAKKYRAELHFRAKQGDWVETTAIAEIDPENGSVLMFKEGYTWKNWV